MRSLTFSAYFCAVLTAPIFAYQQLNHFNQLNLSPQTHVVFWDLDHTLMEPLRYEGSDSWFRELMAVATPEEKSVVINLYCAIQQKTKVRPTDESLPGLWQEWTQQGIPMIGLTARSADLAEITHAQLKSIDLDFNYKDNFSVDISDLSINKHIIFMNGSSKGKALIAVLNKYPELKQKKIIFIDDSPHNLEAVEQALQVLKLDYEVYHYPHSAERYQQLSSLRFSARSIRSNKRPKPF